MASSHHEAHLTRVASLLASGQYSDLTITCRTREFHVHRNILCPASRFFKAACDGEFQVNALLLPIPRLRPCRQSLEVRPSADENLGGPHGEDRPLRRRSRGAATNVSLPVHGRLRRRRLGRRNRRASARGKKPEPSVSQRRRSEELCPTNTRR